MLTEGFPHSRHLLTLDSPTDLIAAVPYLLGFHPGDSIVLLGLHSATMRTRFTGRFDLPPEGNGSEPARLVAARLAPPLRREGCDRVLVVAYGASERADPSVAVLRHEFEHAGIEVGEALRVHRGRYWSYLCTVSSCCPEEGTVYEPDSSPVPAAAVAAGLNARTDRQELVAALAPVQGERRRQMRQATLRAEERCERLCAAHAPEGEEAVTRALRREGVHQVRTAVAAAEKGRFPDSPDQVAWLGLLLVSLRVRDEAWVRIDRSRVEPHLRLWTYVLRHVESAYVPAPASLLAFAAWLGGEGALANIALDRAAEACPDYSMAELLRGLLAHGVAPHRWPGFSPEELAESSPLGPD